MVSNRAAASTPEFNSGRSGNGSLPAESSFVRNRIPQTANRIPAPPPSEASKRLSVSNCRITRHRPAPDAEPDRHFSPPRRRAREQQVRDVGARDGQNQSHHDQQDVERLGIGAPQVIQAGGAILQQEPRKVLSFQVRGCRAGDPGIEDRRQRGLRLRERDSGPQPPHHLRSSNSVRPDSGRSASRILFRIEQQIGVKRKIYVRRLRRIHSEKPRRRHSDRGERNIVDQHRLPGSAGRVAESRFARIRS